MKTRKTGKNVPVKAKAVYRKVDSFNCQLTPAEAIQLARNLLEKAQEAVEKNYKKATVHLWNKDSTVLYCGLRTKAKDGDPFSDSA